MNVPDSPADGVLSRKDGSWIGSFPAMACACEVLMESGDRQDAERILTIVSFEARRIERKFSRYLPGNVVDRINRCDGRAVEVDEETARLLDFAQELHGLSEGMFDVTSGVLRRAWTFDRGDRIPAPETIRAALRHVGWERVEWDGQRIRLAPGMEIDLGGIGKEYAVDRAAQMAGDADRGRCLVNFGGDLVTTGPRRDGTPWRVGIEAPTAEAPGATRIIQLSAEGLATSGDTHRFLIEDGERYSHLLDPRTGWPVADAPRSVTVAAGSCVQAGMMATLAMLHGPAAEGFLEAQGLRYWINR